MVIGATALFLTCDVLCRLTTRSSRAGPRRFSAPRVAPRRER